MTRLRLTLEYDGTGFAGWARQPDLRTVEGVLHDALARTYPSWQNLVVAGRTDAGVHATGQVATVDVGGGPPVDRAAEALNTALPVDVAVRAAAEAPTSFDARRSATGRSYRYVVHAAPTRSALTASRALWWPRPLDEAVLGTAAALLPGSHIFTAFTPADSEDGVSVRQIRAAMWERRGDELHFTITANAFLHHMVRTLVGTMLEGRDLEPLLAGRPRAEAGLTAPPWGLALEHVAYEDDDLADALLAGTLARSISHAEHVRLSIIVLRRLGGQAGTAAVLAGIEGLCARLGAAERFDADLTLRWLETLAVVVADTPTGRLDDLFRTRPELLCSDLCGLPVWAAPG